MTICYYMDVVTTNMQRGGVRISNFDSIKEALKYIDNHLEEPISYESIAQCFHFSPYYFHRMFSVIVGKTIAAHIRDRRLERACISLVNTEETIINIGMDCGYNSAQSFARSFKNAYGLSPSEYRKQGLTPYVITVDEMIAKFTNRLRGGIILNPKIIKHNSLMIAGVSGDGSNTGEVWSKFIKLHNEHPLEKKLSDNGYEIRLYENESCIVHVGFAVSSMHNDDQYELFELPATQYASFDVYVANGYESENSAMADWIETNRDGYKQRLLGSANYCVEYYDERFHGDETGSIVEIWIPIEKC